MSISRWCPLIPALTRWRQGDQKFMVIFGCIALSKVLFPTFRFCLGRWPNTGFTHFCRDLSKGFINLDREPGPHY